MEGAEGFEGWAADVGVEVRLRMGLCPAVLLGGGGKRAVSVGLSMGMIAGVVGWVLGVGEGGGVPGSGVDGLELSVVMEDVVGLTSGCVGSGGIVAVVVGMVAGTVWGVVIVSSACVCGR